MRNITPGGSEPCRLLLWILKKTFYKLPKSAKTSGARNGGSTFQCYRCCGRWRNLARRFNDPPPNEGGMVLSDDAHDSGDNYNEEDNEWWNLWYFYNLFYFYYIYFFRYITNFWSYVESQVSYLTEYVMAKQFYSTKIPSRL